MAPLKKLFFAFFLLIAPLTCSAADDVLSIVPKDSLGAVVIRTADGLQEKIRQLGEDLEVPIPDLIEMTRQRSGLNKGVNNAGSIAAILFETPAGSSPPVSLVYCVAVSDYDQLAESVDATEPVDGVSEVMINGRRLLLAKKGNYALVAAHRFADDMQKVLSSDENVVAGSAPLTSRIDKTDVYALISPNGLSTVKEKLMLGLGFVKGQIIAMQPENRNAVVGLSVYESLFETLDQEYSFGLIGIELDTVGVRFLKSGLLADGGTIRSFAASVEPMSRELVNDIADENFVFSSASTVPEAAGTALVKWSVSFLNDFLKEADLSESDLNELTEATSGMLKDIDSMSMSLGTVGDGQPLYENMTLFMKVDNADRFLKNYEVTMNRMSEIMGKATNSPFRYSTSRSKLDGHDVLEISTDMSAFEGPDPAQTRQMMKMMFGDADTLMIYMAAADDSTVVGQYVSKDRLQQRLQQATEQAQTDSDVLKTLSLLPKSAMGVGFWSPAGTMTMVRQLVGTTAPQLDMLPELPQSPPIGMALSLQQDRIDVDAVIPKETLQTVTEYIKSLRAARIR